MKKIVDYQKLLGVTKEADLKELKTVYRNFMKEFHPDKFQDEDDKKLEAEEKSKTIIEAYHFLVSIAPETIAQSFEQYKLTTSTSGIVDYEFKSQTLKITFADGSVYEYFDVPKSVYTKMVNSDSIARFAKRHVYHEFKYRNINKLTTDTQN